jgi:hypothetical protein
MINQSTKLKTFYTEFQAWIDTGFSSHECFHPNIGICSNLDSWIEFNLYDDTTSENLSDELRKQFIEAGLHEVFPFDPQNEFGATSYTVGFKYNNEARVAWIKEHSA